MAQAGRPARQAGSTPAFAHPMTPMTEHWQQRWYPVAYLDDLDRRRPTPFTFLGTDLVLWL